MRTVLYPIAMLALYVGVVQDVAFAQLLDDSDENYVRVPGGRRLHKTCVHEVPAGSYVDQNLDVWMGDHLVQHIPMCTYVGKRDTPTTSGWIEDAYDGAFTNSYGFNWFNALKVHFGVPGTPSSPQGLVFLWPGMYDATDGNYLLQPVLQYGTGAADGGGNYYSMNNWYVTSTTAVWGTLVNVRSLDTTVTAYVYIDSSKPCNDAGTDCTWVVAFSINGDPIGLNYLEVTTPKPPDKAYNGVLESYNMTICDAFPSTSTTFTDDYLYMPGPHWDNSVALLTNQWDGEYTAGVSPSCGYAISLSGADATFNY